jgi:hypothetical protein
MTPRTRLRPLFDGVITIADGTFAVMGVDVKPNETFTIPFVRDLDLTYRQQFSLYDEDFWLPTDIRISGSFTVSVLGLSVPKISLEQTSAMYDYAVNIAIPDSILHQPHLRTDSSAAVIDSVFWRQHDVLPLTPGEQRAYVSLDSTQTLEKQFEPTGPLAFLGFGGNSSLAGVLDARFNRVEGFYLGASGEIDSLVPNTSLRLGGGVGFSDQVFKYIAGATLFNSAKRTFGLGGDVYRELEHTPDGNAYGPFVISFMALIDKNDYRDYYLASGWRAFTVVAPSRVFETILTYTNDQEYSLANATDYSFFGQPDPYRANPAIEDGNMRSLRLDMRLGRRAEPLDLIGRNALELSVENSSPKIFRSAFDFIRYHGSLEWTMPTFSRSFLFPQTLRFRVTAGTSGRSLPRQLDYTLDTRSSGVATFGVLRGGYVKEFIGDQYVMLNVEHNFRSMPFLFLNLPFLYRNNIELIIHGSFAQSWLGGVSTSNGWYSEAGVGLSRILDIIRMDLTYRFAQPQGLHFSVSLATLF